MSATEMIYKIVAYVLESKGKMLEAISGCKGSRL